MNENDRPETERMPGGVTGKGFMPGQSGNPGGRPKGQVALLKEKYGDDGEKLIEALDAIAMDVKVAERVRIQALTELLDRGWGKPTQTLNHEGLAHVPIYALPDGVRPSVSKER